MMSVNTIKDRISIHNTKYLLLSVILKLNTAVGGLSIRLKIKKEKYQNKNNKRKQKTTTKNEYYCQAGIRTTITCVESEDHSHWSFVSYG